MLSRPPSSTSAVHRGVEQSGMHASCKCKLLTTMDMWTSFKRLMWLSTARAAWGVASLNTSSNPVNQHAHCSMAAILTASPVCV